MFPRLGAVACSLYPPKLTFPLGRGGLCAPGFAFVIVRKASPLHGSRLSVDRQARPLHPSAFPPTSGALL